MIDSRVSTETMDDHIALFMDITSATDANVAAQFLDMAGGNLDTAVGLYFEHGAGSVAGAATTEATSNNEDEDGDAGLASRLQQEMYEEPVRQPIEPTYDTLVPQDYGYGMGTGTGIGMGPGYVPQGGMFGRQQSSVFNQTGRDVVVLDSDSEDEEMSGMSATQKRLASIFRPPWDIIDKIDFQTAKDKGRQLKKWILINIQDVTDFRCQCLNRDFWSSQQIKQLVSANFVFLQYQHDSPSGEMYRNLYPFHDEYPHIAILDPITGERMMTWNANPPVHRFIEQVVDFLDQYKLDGSAPFVAPTSQGLNKNHAVPISDEEDEDIQEHENDMDEKSYGNVEPSAEEVSEQEGEISVASVIKSLPAKDIEDPSGESTRIQIRSGIDGKRVVKKLALDTTIRQLFQFVKFAFQESLNGQPFTLKMQRVDLSESLDITVSEAKLQNASILLELIDE